MKVRYIFPLLTICLLIVISLHTSYAGENIQPKLTVNFHQKKLGDVADIIFKQTGYKLLLDEHLQDIQVSGEFKSIELEPFLSAILKGNSHFTVTSHETKTVTVQSASESNSIPSHSMDSNSTSTDDHTSYDTPATNSSGEFDEILELDNNFKIAKSDNNKHLIDSQTNKPWDEIEKELNY